MLEIKEEIMTNERDMRKAVHAWLSPDGSTEVIYEFLMMRGYCDMVGILFAKQTGRTIPLVKWVTAVELKLEDVAGVIRQSRGNRHSVHASFAAMPKPRCQRMQPTTVKKFLEAGIGLLSVGDDVTVAIPPGEPLVSKNINIEHFRKRWWSRIVRDKRENSRVRKEARN